MTRAKAEEREERVLKSGFKGTPDAKERLGLEIQAETSGDVAPRVTRRSLDDGESAKLCVGSGIIQPVLRDMWARSRDQHGLGRRSERRRASG